MTYVRGDDETDVVERDVARVDNYSLEIELLLGDSGFYNDAPPAVLVTSSQRSSTFQDGEWGKDELDVDKSYTTIYRIFNDDERELRFPLAVAVSYQNGDEANTARLFGATWCVA